MHQWVDLKSQHLGTCPAWAPHILEEQNWVFASSEHSNELLPDWEGLTQQTGKGYSLSQNIAVGRRILSMRLQLGAHGGTEGEAPQRRGQSFSAREQDPNTHSPQTENSPTLLKTAKEKNQNKILAAC